MKQRYFSAQSLLSLPSIIQFGTALGIILSSTAQAVDYFKADNITALNQSLSWTGSPTAPNGSAPSDTYDWIWDNRVLAANTPPMGNDLRVRTIKILDPGGLVTIDGVTNNRTISVASGGGIDMSAATQNLVIQNLSTGTELGVRLLSSGANMSVQVANLRTLTLNSKIAVNGNSSTSTATVNFTGPGTMICNADMKANRLNIASGEVQLNNATGSARPGTAAVATTIVNGGKLVLNNTSGSATGNSAVTINSTGTVTGPGAMTGVVTINSGGTISPGTGLGTLKAGSLILAANSVVRWEGDPTLVATPDLIDVTGTDTLAINGGKLELYNVGTNDPFTGAGTFNIFKYTGAIPNTANLVIAESTKLPDRSYIPGVSGGYVTLTIGVDTRPKGFWDIDGDGSWSTPTNWTNDTTPNASTFIANLGGAQGTPITAPRTVTISSPHTVGTLNFDSAQSFTLAGSGVLTFDEGASAGTLHVENGSHLISAPLALPTEGVLASLTNAASTLTLQGEINGDGGISKSGPGTLILGADNLYLGVTSNGAGTLQLGEGGATGSVNGAISNNGTLVINRSSPLDLDNPISGTGGVNFAGAGNTRLLVENTFSGPTTISAGSVEIGDNLALKNSTLTYSAASGTLTFVEFLSSVTLGGLTGDKAFPLTDPIGNSVNLTVGQNNASNSYTGSTVGTGAAFTKAGTGTFTLTGTHLFSGNTSINAGVLSLDTGSDFTTAAVNTTAASAKLRLNGGTLNASASALIDNASAGFEIISGTATFGGAISNPANISSGNCFINVTGGTLNAGSLSLSRSSLNLGTTEPATGSATNGLYINGGAVNITGTMLIGNNANSTVNARMDSGSLTVNGAATLAINSPDRWSILDIAGGTFTSIDPTTGVRLGGASAGQVVMHVRGASTVAKAERIQFGQSAFTGSAILNQTGGSLFVGAGGMVVGSTGITAQLRLAGGVLGATADSASTVPVSLTGPAVVTGADSLDVPHTVTFSGSVTGTGSLTKNGSGSVSFTSSANSFSGTVSVNSGNLGLAGQSGAVTVATTARLTPRARLNPTAASVINGTLGIQYDAPALPPGEIRSQGVLTLGAASILDISGTGTLTGPVYVLASGTAGISGTFSSVTGTVPGYTLNSSFNNGSGFPVIALVSNTASPFDLWAASFGLSGANAGTNADPDNDGVKNLVEFGLGTNPTLSSSGPALGQSGNFLTITFPHIADPALVFTIEASDSLSGTWTTVHTFPAFVTPGTATYTDNVAVGSTEHRFLRLSVAN